MVCDDSYGTKTLNSAYYPLFTEETEWKLSRCLWEPTESRPPGVICLRLLVSSLWGHWVRGIQTSLGLVHDLFAYSELIN